MEKLPNRYNKINIPNGITDNRENITIEAQQDIWPIGKQQPKKAIPQLKMNIAIPDNKTEQLLEEV